LIPSRNPLCYVPPTWLLWPKGTACVQFQKVGGSARSRPPGPAGRSSHRAFPSRCFGHRVHQAGRKPTRSFSMSQRTPLLTPTHSAFSDILPGAGCRTSRAAAPPDGGTQTRSERHDHRRRPGHRHPASQHGAAAASGLVRLHPFRPRHHGRFSANASPSTRSIHLEDHADFRPWGAPFSACHRSRATVLMA
jgi:hypothetical protein